ncbi:hypothetical protein BT63DRAFT_438258 [Microthyrium microscopicum]|uniref:Uncharacterized protein n=1 Tax=Microthyrium microscopicum TaxID=703497 RepID=A0A6A6ULZ3_9PEZI|nr:hypothetical protein BT63DRAFT_438258 [Microthyrium microscopicum]
MCMEQSTSWDCGFSHNTIFPCSDRCQEINKNSIKCNPGPCPDCIRGGHPKYIKTGTKWTWNTTVQHSYHNYGIQDSVAEQEVETEARWFTGRLKTAPNKLGETTKNLGDEVAAKYPTKAEKSKSNSEAKDYKAVRDERIANKKLKPMVSSETKDNKAVGNGWIVEKKPKSNSEIKDNKAVKDEQIVAKNPKGDNETDDDEIVNDNWLVVEKPSDWGIFKKS